MSRIRRLAVGEATRLADPWAAAAVYVLLAGGLMAGTFVPELRLLTGAIGVVMLAAFLRGLAGRHDALDLVCTLALLLVAIGALASTQPRASTEMLWFGLVILATFVRLRRAFADEGRRDRLLAVGGRIAVGVALVVAAVWLLESTDWIRQGGPGPLPPAGLDYSDDWLRNINVIPVYLALLLPALVYCWAVRGERTLAVAGLLATAVVTMLSASRTAWLGIGAGIVVFALAGVSWRRVRLSRRAVIGAASVIAAAVVLSVVSGLAQSLLEGVGDLATLRSRSMIWEAAVAVWRAHPLAGAGLGTITTDLLVGGLAVPGSPPAPHAHSMPIQVLAETGLLGAAAWLAILGTIGWLLIRRRPRATAAPSARDRLVRGAALGALVAFLVDGLGDNHTALSAIDLLAVGNVGLLLPVANERISPQLWVAPRAWRLGRALLAGLMALFTAGILAWALAAVAWGRSQGAVQAGNAGSAIDALQVAVSLDPGMALYSRELGKLLAAAGETARGETLLAESARDNPGDPNTQRTLGVLALRDGHADAAIGFLNASLALDGTDSRTRLLLGMALDATGQRAEADLQYATGILLSPEIALSDGWAAIGVPSGRLAALTEQALTTASAGPVDTWPGLQRVELLSVLGRRSDLTALLARTPILTGRAWLALAEAETGDNNAARQLLEASLPEGRRAPAYWIARAETLSVLGDAAGEAQAYRLGALLRETIAAPAGLPSLSGPISRDANDFWMYQRSTAWFTDRSGPLLPNAGRGSWLRVHDPGRIELPRGGASTG